MLFRRASQMVNQRLRSARGGLADLANLPEYRKVGADYLRTDRVVFVVPFTDLAAPPGRQALSRDMFGARARVLDPGSPAERRSRHPAADHCRCGGGGSESLNILSRLTRVVRGVRGSRWRGLRQTPSQLPDQQDCPHVWRRFQQRICVIADIVFVSWRVLMSQSIHQVCCWGEEQPCLLTQQRWNEGYWWDSIGVLCFPISFAKTVFM